MTDGPAVPPEWHTIPKLVSDISEDFYCAGWLVDAEFAVWRMIQQGGGWGMGAAGDIPETLGALRSLACSTGHWVRWDSDAEPPTQPIPLSEWEPLYDEWNARIKLAQRKYEDGRCAEPCPNNMPCQLDRGHEGDHFEDFLSWLVSRSETKHN